MGRLVRATIVAAAAGGALAAFGFMLFATNATRHLPAVIGPADGIVVLTGGEHRLETGIRLLMDGRARRLLISGVNPRTSRDDVRRQFAHAERHFACCIDIGYAARDTIGNAEETRSWSEALGMRSIIVVTAGYHMPRSLIELQRAMPGVALIAHAVTPRLLDRGDLPWWLHVRSLRVLGAEYVKFLPALARYQVSRLLRPFDATALAVARF